MLPEEISLTLHNLAGPRDNNRRPRKLAARLSQFIAQQNRSRTRIFPNEREVLAAVASEVDKERNSQRAWELIDDPQKSNALKRPPELDFIIEAVSGNIHKATGSYLYGKRNQASGVFIEIDGRVFLASTAHSIPDDLGNGLLLTGYTARSQHHRARIIGYGDGKSLGLDIAYLECERDFVRQTLGKIPVELNRLHPCGPGIAGKLAFVCGFPAKETKIVRTSSQSADIVLQAITYPFPPLMPKYWKVVREQKGVALPNSKTDAFIPYDPEEPVLQYRTRTRIKLPDPGGMSGGGFWIGPPRKKSIWTAESYKLFAIQSSFHETGRYLRGVQIVHWLRLIWFHHPDLRRRLEQAFPKVDWTP